MNNLAQIYNNELIDGNADLYLYFTSGDSKYALQVSRVLEIIKLPSLEYPQKLPNNVLGLLNYNNLTVNVLDIRFYLNIPVTPYNESNQLLIVKTDEAIFGLVVNKVDDIINFEKENIEHLPFSSGENLIDSLYHINDETISIINLYSLEGLLKRSNYISENNVQDLFPKDDESRRKMQKRTRDLADKSRLNLAKGAYSDDKFISFALNYGSYCIDLDCVKEVIKNAVITKVPCTPDYIAGVMTLRGDFITVVDIKKFLNLSSDTPFDKSRVIVIETEDYKIGFLVDEIFEIFEISEENITKKNYSHPKYVLSENVIDGKLYVILDMKKILSDERFFYFAE